MSQPTLALLGTSADPPTEGHRALLAGLAQHYGAVATWASDNPFKEHGAPLELRAQLLAALVHDLNDPRISHMQALSSPRALTTVTQAAERWPGHGLVFVVGGDLAEQVPRWWRAEELLQGCRLGIARRQGWPLQAAGLERLRGLGATLDLLPLAIPPSASSRIRERPDPAQVPSELWPVLLQHNLYGLSGP